MAQAKQRFGNAGLHLGAQQEPRTCCPMLARTVLAIFSRYDEPTGRSLAVLKVNRFGAIASTDHEWWLLG